MSKILPMLIANTGLSESDVISIVSNAPSRYVTYPIKKRNGQDRWISQPAREVKAMQNIIITEVLNGLPIDAAATAYREGISIKYNAAAHAKSGTIVKYDLKDFFPSIRSEDWKQYAKKNSVFSDDRDIAITSNIMFFRRRGSSVLRLAIGAPSSPILSNILMREFDEKIAEKMLQQSVVYTRYADDMTFSARRTGYLQQVDAHLRQVLKEIKSPSLRINEEKTVWATKKYKRMVTGLIITNDGGISVGQKRKRLIRSALYRFGSNELTLKQQAWLAGMMAFLWDVEPTFYYRMVERYGDALIKDLKFAGQTYKELPSDWQDG